MGGGIRLNPTHFALLRGFHFFLASLAPELQNRQGLKMKNPNLRWDDHDLIWRRVRGYFSAVALSCFRFAQVEPLGVRIPLF